MKTKEALEKLVDELVIPKGLHGIASLDLKIDLLSFAIEYLRYQRRQKDTLSFDEFVQCHIDVEGGRLMITAPPTFKSVGTGTRPIRLQGPLLLFLLLHHGDRYQVLDIIELFVEQIRQQLSFVDFKKTKTGVTRCFTNIRFAANILRKYGLLKFTRKEAFKTWELSLTGFLVAADILSNRSAAESAWELPCIDKNAKLHLAPEIYLATTGLDSFDIFVRKLTFICRPDSSIFTSFKPALEGAFDLLQSYWPILRDESKTHQDRRNASLERIQLLNQLGDGFFNELARSIQINDLLRRTLEGASQE